MRILLLLSVVCLSIASAPARSQRQDVFDRQSLKDSGALSAAQDSALRARRELIVSEASTSSANEWTGTYVSEDGPTSGAQLDWAPVSGFVVWWNTCSHSWRDRINFGSVAFLDGNLRVKSELGREGEKVYALSSELIAVKWGEQHYLVPLDQLIAFCYAARNDGRSLELKEFFVKQSDRKKRRFGLPAVPSHYKKYLVGPPIQATIVEVNSQPQRTLEDFTLNVGRTAGVVPGMKFFALSPNRVYLLVEVTNVRDSDSDAYVITSGFTNKSAGQVKLQAGWKLTSRAPKRAYEYYPG